MAARHVLLIIGGGIAAYKSLELMRRLLETGIDVTPVMTRAAHHFVTPLSVSALAGQKVYTDLFDLTDEAEMGHIELSRSADLVLVAPATADIMAKMAAGLADDLASTLLLATDTPVMLAPAMNVRMWEHHATQRNLAYLRENNVRVVGPSEGVMACGEFGPGRLAEVDEIVGAVQAAFADGPLAGRHILITSGPTHEPIDPVRYIANRSSGQQGTAIAKALLALGAKLSFVTGPACLPPPEGADVIKVETAQEMFAAVETLENLDAAVFAAAVADWRVDQAATSKIKKDASGHPQDLKLVQNPDILAHVAQRTRNRPRLVVGFAAETDDVIAQASQKRLRKGCDWIVANDVSPDTGVFGGGENTVTLITSEGSETWPRMRKDQIARQLAQRIAKALL